MLPFWSPAASFMPSPLDAIGVQALSPGPAPCGQEGAGDRGGHEAHPGEGVGEGVGEGFGGAPAAAQAPHFPRFF